jgi:hypothetical protein
MHSTYSTPLAFRWLLVSVWQNTGFVAYETASANWDASFNFSLQNDTTSTTRLAFRSIERTAVASANAETMARDREK